MKITRGKQRFICGKSVQYWKLIHHPQHFWICCRLECEAWARSGKDGVAILHFWSDMALEKEHGWRSLVLSRSVPGADHFPSILWEFHLRVWCELHPHLEYNHSSWLEESQGIFFFFFWMMEGCTSIVRWLLENPNIIQYVDWLKVTDIKLRHDLMQCSFFLR